MAAEALKLKQTAKAPLRGPVALSDTVLGTKDINKEQQQRPRETKTLSLSSGRVGPVQGRSRPVNTLADAWMERSGRRLGDRGCHVEGQQRRSLKCLLKKVGSEPCKLQ